MTKPGRYGVIDAIRGLAVLNMILFHLCYDVFVVFGVWEAFYMTVPAIIWERLICFTFIVVSGISLNFSKHGKRRGMIVLLCGFTVTLATVLITPEQAILFGALHFLGAAMILGALCKPLLDSVDPLWSMLAFYLLHILTYGVPDGCIGLFSYPLIKLPEALYRYSWLSFLGFRSESFFSSDYFPILPWIFLYFFGYELWRFIRRKELDRLFVRKIPVLDFVGRHSLIIYMAHQPILYGICCLIFK